MKTINILLALVLVAGLALVVGPVPVAWAAVITVNSTADVIAADGYCTLREAITAANTDTAFYDCPAGSGADTIALPAGTYVLSIGGYADDANASGDLDISGSLTINGAGASSTIIDANYIDRVLHVLGGATVVLNDLTLTHGFSPATPGGGVRNQGALTLRNSVVSDSAVSSPPSGSGSGGGGVHSGGTLTIEGSTISGNAAPDAVGTGEGGEGGGVYISWGSATIQNSTISHNITGQGAQHPDDDGDGGGVYVWQGTVTLENSTISGNEAKASGGGVYLSVYTGPYSTANLIHCTVTENIADADADDPGSNHGGGLSGAGTYNVKNTIIAGNTDWGLSEYRNCSVSNYTSGGYNLVGPGGFGCWLVDTDQYNDDAGLGSLQHNGGATETHALLYGSPAVDMIPNGSSGCGDLYGADQRGESRPANGDHEGTTGCDSGAFELQESEAPVANDDGYTTDEDTTLTVNVPGVLDNDTDYEGDSLTANLDSGPASGALTLNADGSFTYVPDADFSGTDSFTYKAHDGTLDSAVATVTLTVSPVPDVPVAVDDYYGTDGQTTLIVAAPGVLGNDSDADGDALYAILDLGPHKGGLSWGPLDGSFTYTPGPSFDGTDSFSYYAMEGSGSKGWATVTITTGPLAYDDSYSTEQDTPLTVNAPGVLDNDSDGDGDTLTAVWVNGPSYGMLTLNADGSFTYTPNEGYYGADSFTYRAHGGALDSAVATVTITVNGSPVATNDTASTNEDNNVIIDVLANDQDPDGDLLTISEVSDLDHGTVTTNDDGTVTYAPHPDFCGQDSFSYTISDGNDGSDTATVTVGVACVEDDPVAVDDNAATNEHTAVTIDVLANDSDGDGDTLTIVSLTHNQLHGYGIVTNNGTNVTYAPNEVDWCGSNVTLGDSFVYEVSDGNGGSATATVWVRIDCVDDPPEAVDDTATATENDAATTIDVLDNDLNPDYGPMSIYSVTGPANGTVAITNGGADLTYEPNADYCNDGSPTDDFTYTLTPGSSEATVRVSVTCGNEPPVAVDDEEIVTEDDPATTINVLSNDTDVDGGPMSIGNVIQPANGTVVITNGGADLTYQPNADYCNDGIATDDFTYILTPGGSQATVSITVDCENDPPVANGDAYETAEDTVLDVVAPGVLGNDTDADGDELTAYYDSNPSHGTLALVDDGSFTYTPDVDYCGEDSFTYYADDDLLDSNDATVTINVTCVNDPPVANDDSYNADEDTTLTVPAPGVLGNDPDVDVDALSAALDSGPANGALTLNANGSFSYTPDAGFSGTDTFVYHANDGALDSNDATVTITVNAAVPVLEGISPAAAPAGSAGVTIDLTGSGFVSASQVQWDGTTDLVTTYVNAGQLTAVIPAGLLASVGTAQITVYTPAPGGGTSNVLAFFVTADPAGVTGQDAVSGANPTASYGSTSASATGDDGLLVVAEYDANPGGTPSFEASGTYFDVYISPGATFSGVTIQACDLGGGDKLYWWDSVSGEWKRAIDPSYDTDTGCITLIVTDDGSSSPTLSQLSGTAFAGAINDPPMAEAGGPYLGAVDTDIQFDGSASSDPDSDPLTYAWDFGDDSDGTGEMPTHSYAGVGIYNVCLTVSDGALESENCTIAVVYDDSAGFVTGGGWIDSPAGAYVPEPDLSGRASFGFVSKYKKGASVPTGSTEFQFQAGGFNFHSDSYEWLVVTGKDYAMFKGVGTINGEGVYKFMLWAGDGEPDTFRIRIWWEDDAGVEYDVYDNGTDQAIGGGSVVVHVK